MGIGNKKLAAVYYNQQDTPPDHLLKIAAMSDLEVSQPPALMGFMEMLDNAGIMPADMKWYMPTNTRDPAMEPVAAVMYGDGDAPANMLQVRFDGGDPMALLKTKRFDFITATGWTAVGVASGTIAVNDPTYMVLRAAALANSSILARVTSGFLNSNTLPMNRIDWDKVLLFMAHIAANPSDAQAVRRMQLKEATAIGQLAELGIGISIANLTITGEAYGTSRGTLAFTTNLTVNQPAILAILLKSTGAEFFLDNVSQGIISAAGTFPTGDGVAEANLVFSNANGAAGTQSDLYVGGIRAFQEV